jgi:hypothetical protein
VRSKLRFPYMFQQVASPPSTWSKGTIRRAQDSAQDSALSVATCVSCKPEHTPWHHKHLTTILTSCRFRGGQAPGSGAYFAEDARMLMPQELTLQTVTVTRWACLAQAVLHVTAAHDVGSSSKGSCTGLRASAMSSVRPMKHL